MRYPNAIAAVELRREVDHDKAARARIAPLAQPGEDALLGIVDDQPFEAGTLAVEFMQRRQRAVDLVEVTHKLGKPGMRR